MFLHSFGLVEPALACVTLVRGTSLPVNVKFARAPARVTTLAEVRLLVLAFNWKVVSKALEDLDTSLQRTLSVNLHILGQVDLIVNWKC